MLLFPSCPAIDTAISKGRSQRGKIDRKVEDFINELQRITIVHERREPGSNDIYKVIGQTPAESDD
jgi:H+-transporting ATPase